MILFPAVDIKNGECVRLAQGKEDQVTVFASDPVAQARYWAELGARFLHVVDLDGAFSGVPRNFELIRDICAAIDIPVQLGGGIRDIETARKYIEAGVHRLIIGTMALENPDLFTDLCAALPGRIGVSLDAVDGRLKTKGWVADAGLTVDDVLPRLENDGVRFIVYTDISRDGMQTGVNVDGLASLCGKTSIPVIAAGGVHTLDDIRNLYPLSRNGLEGAISGRAIYVGTLDVKEANAWIDAQ
ncbi:MAG: 1-(5-phosphoribosyl)-5-[(5-phosphoribosylamino)methylideneamino]imidazole-4-carboxamide isomerase [Desulfovibrionaceae bacterium]|nr:1-(5-phosphoribosyl)-5-[(5-phosphoribosylamino)methylideneamino]imidazole-4-carboxamide isomerase [Desulfovibrionaceae bacterium]